MIHYEGKPVAYHFDAAGSEPMFNEGSRESVWWLPNDTTDAHLIIANAGAKPVEAVVTLFAQSGKTYSRHVSLAARQMARFSIRELVTTAGFSDTYGGLRVTVGQGAESVFVSHLAFDLTTGFSALLKVFENSPEENPPDVTLRAPMLALSNPDPVLSLSQGTVLHPKVFLRNTKNSPLTVKGELRWRGAGTQGVQRLPDAALNGNETRIVDLSAMQQDGTIPKDASWGYLKLNYSGRYGDLVAIAASYDASLTHGLQTPFSDIVASHWVGSKWYADDVRNSLLTAGNGGDKPTNVLFTLHYNGGKSKYEIQQPLAPGEQMFLDTGKIIASQAPDKNGSTIPPDVRNGSFSIRNLDDPLGTYLFEGKLTIDTKYGNAFYGCSYCCNPGGPPGMDPNPFNQLVGDVWANSVWGYDVCDDSPYDVTARAYGWWSSNTTVMTVNTSGVSTGIGAGSAFLNSTIYIPNALRLKCPYAFYYPQSSGSVCAVPTNFHQVQVADIGGGALRFDYVWGSSTGKLPDLGTSGCTVSEIVTYSGSNPYYPPSPPWATGYNVPNPTISPNPPKPGQDGSLEDRHLTGNFGTSYAVASYTATQYYRYSCTCNNSSNVNLAGPISITRSVSQNADGTWKYTVTKSGASASINPLP